MTQMMTKTKLYALDLRSFTATIEQLGEQLRANQEKLGDIAHAKETIASGMQGQSAQAMIAKLDALEQKINDHITSIQETQAAITTTAPTSSSSNVRSSTTLTVSNSIVFPCPMSG